MALFHLVYFSDVLGVQTPVDVIIPEGKQAFHAMSSLGYIYQ